MNAFSEKVEPFNEDSKQMLFYPVTNEPLQILENDAQ